MVVPEQAIKKFLRLKADARGLNLKANELAASAYAERMRAADIRSQLRKPVASYRAEPDGGLVASPRQLEAYNARLRDAEEAERNAARVLILAQEASEQWNELAGLVRACERELLDRGVPQRSLDVEIRYRGLGPGHP